MTSVCALASGFQDRSSCMLRDRRRSLLDAERNILHLDHEARLDDLPNRFSVDRSHHIEREPRTSTAKQFDAVDPGDENIADGLRPDAARLTAKWMTRSRSFER